MSRVLGRAQFEFQRRVRGFDVPSLPFFDSISSTQWFLDQLQCSCSYVEFGSGGSTVQAARLGVTFTTTESDSFFLRAVRRKIEEAGWNRPSQTFRHAHLGRTTEWGYPAGRATPQRLSAYRSYSTFPGSSNVDLVLVDGRFRVACALKALSALRGSSGWTVVIDDYAGRDQYRVLGDLASIEMVGRMAVITSAGNDDLAPAIAEYETDPA